MNKNESVSKTNSETIAARIGVLPQYPCKSWLTRQYLVKESEMVFREHTETAHHIEPRLELIECIVFELGDHQT